MAEKPAHLLPIVESLSATPLSVATDHPQPQRAKPFLKWAGGKKQLLPQLLSRLPRHFHRYYEPMVGGGALFFYLAPQGAFLSDTNSELINAYKVLQSALDPLIVALRDHIYQQEYYYQLRDADRLPEYANWSNVQKASRLIFLNKTCFNGLFRVNAKGYFNTPFGRYSNPRIVDELNLRLCHQALKGTTLEATSFEQIAKTVKVDDFVYFDPPYATSGAGSPFTAYCAAGFDLAMHRELRDFCSFLNRQQVKFMLSNSFSPETIELFSAFRVETVQARRAINSKVEGRGEIKEIIVRNY